MNNRGYFGIGVYHPKHEENVGTLWRSAFAFHAAFIFTVGRRFHKQASDTPKAWHHVPMLNYCDMEDFLRHMPHDCPLIGVEIAPNAHPLDRFVHPERCIYLLGAEDHGLPTAVINKCQSVLEVANLRTCLNVATAGSLVLYDRQVKRVAGKVEQWVHSRFGGGGA